MSKVPKILLSMPVADKPELKTLFSLYQAVATCGYEVKIYATEGDSLISRVRNSHITVFYDEFKDFDYFVSIDSDLEIINKNPNDNIFKKLISHDLDFVGGLYALKSYEDEPKTSSLSSAGENKIPYNSGLVEMDWLSSGCWCLKRSAIKKMIDHYPELIYDGDGLMSGKKVYGLYVPFISDMGNDKKKYLSEDWAFAERWRASGGKIFADTTILLNHIGKFPYSLWD
jgi:hypothetical protein